MLSMMRMLLNLFKLSGIWNFDVLAKLCVAYLNDNVTINNACRFYNFALDNDDQHKPQIVSKFIREHFTSLYESGQLSELSLKNFTIIIEHDEINVMNEDVTFSSAVQIINQQTSVDEDINRCLELIRFPHTSGDFFSEVHTQPSTHEKNTSRQISKRSTFVSAKQNIYTGS